MKVVMHMIAVQVKKKKTQTNLKLVNELSSTITENVGFHNKLTSKSLTNVLVPMLLASLETTVPTSTTYQFIKIYNTFNSDKKDVH